MNARLEARLLRASIEAATPAPRPHRMTRKDRKALRVALVLVVCTLGLLARGWL